MSESSPELSAEQKIQQALRGIWISSRATLEERISVLAQAQQALAAGALSPELQKLAESAAHKLAGVLGTFGLPQGSALATKLERAFAADDEARMESGEIQQWLAALKEEMAAQDRRYA
ncbi:Hpt domain-containing protein [Silvibacterium sp.]|uniref:Hpt domain-containing protein n=1 Tax=Silvibacterium sp. TaxID=1964179 RepID=UPI0039E2599D